MNTSPHAGLSHVEDSVSLPRLAKQLTLDSRIGRRAHRHAVGLGSSPRAAARRTFAIGAACMGMLAVETQAAITFSDPIRSVSASNNKGSSQAIETHGYEPFNESARVDWEEYWSYPNAYLGQYPNTTGRYFSTATQESIIGLTGVAARGSVLGTGSFDCYGETPLQQVSHSYFKINLLLDAPGNIHLNGVIWGERDPWGTNSDNPEISLTLTGASGEYYSKNISPWNYLETYQHAINESFISLPPGQYEFVVSLKTAGRYETHENFHDDTTGDVWITPGSGGYGNATYEITIVPEPSQIALGALSCLWFVARRKRTAGVASS